MMQDRRRRMQGPLARWAGRPLARWAARPRTRPRPRWAVRLVAVLGSLAVMLLAGAGPASAHDVLISSDPADGATLDVAPAAVSFTFDAAVQNYDPVLLIYGPNGNTFGGTPTVTGSVISAPLHAGPAGSYRAVYRIVSADGHPVTGQITFTLTAAAAGTALGTPNAQGTGPAGGPPADHAGSSGGGLSPWLWVGIGVAAVLVVAAVVIALRRPTDRGERPAG